MPETFKTYYELLGLRLEASPREIKSAFRRKAKAFHPDTARNDARSMRLILEAYRTLSDPRLRLEYDRTLRRSRHRTLGYPSFDYRTWLLEHSQDPQFRAKLVMYDLLHDRDDEALKYYESISGDDRTCLVRYFDRGEAMDAEFCIAELYEKRGEWKKAYDVYLRLLAMEREKPAFGYFFDVVILQFRRLVLDRYPSEGDLESYLSFLDEAGRAVSDPEDSARFLRRKAELLIKAGNRSEALAVLREVESRAPRLPGIKPLFRKLGA
ncbi:MAG TPA: DnaJ domain-containing protein [Magnetospirillaceae bacterium]|nr:DnaJ domain-containing protein [Magnetospirillaceae bacterium]